MGRLSRKLRIGEKIGLGFGLVGLIFLAVAWQYHNTLQRTLADYQMLQDVFEARKSSAQMIENSMLRAQIWEKTFLLNREEAAAREVSQQVQDALAIAKKMAGIDQPAADTADQISRLMNAYHQRFLAVLDAWRSMGLDHNSGLQGAFRNTVHQLEEMAGQLRADRLYLQLLQIRRSEKDLGLRLEQQYRSRVLDLIRGFEEETAASALEEGVKVRLLHEIETYREAFLEYASGALAGADIDGGKGPFRQTAHRIEALINSHYVPDLGHDILQLRRREKDYLLRGDKKYVDMALTEVQNIRSGVENSSIPEQVKNHFTELLQNYQRDFLALVAQNGQIDGLTAEMREAVTAISLLVQQNVDSANQAMERMTAEINASSQRNERLMLWSLLFGTLLGIAFTIAITLHIVRPLRKMAGLLDQLAYEEPAERLKFYPGGRDEVNAMVGSVNTMADHKTRFITWWKTAMQEADACERLDQLLSSKQNDSQATVEELQSALADLRRALAGRHSLLSAHYQKLHRLNGWIIERAERLLQQGYSGQDEIALDSIRYSARSMQAILELITHQDKNPQAPGGAATNS